ncbi:MAG: PAS domain S-box protein [Candidatus Solibacter usitatus]|nr:PAS domain S-box protein [Candidatus Solibacter usitatus]
MNDRPAGIFIVEDEALIALEIKDRLAQLGYGIRGISARGEEALAQIAATRPDLVLMDVHLAGGMSGIETARRLRETSDVPVVFLTAYSDEDLLRQAVATEPFGYLVKPFQGRELHATIQMALYKHRTEREMKEANARLDEKVLARTAELEEANAALRASEAFNRSLIEHLPLKLFLKNLDSVYLMVNEGYAGDFRLTPADFAGRDDFAFHPRELAEKYQADDREVICTGQVKEVEESYIVEGRRFWIQTIKAPLRDANGRVTGLLGIFRDITARKEAQEALRESELRYRLLFQESVDGLALADAGTGTLIDCNEAFCALVGWERAELVGRPQRMLHPPEEAQGEVSDTFERHRSAETGKVIETHILTKAGEIRDVEIKGAPLKVGGQLVLLGVFRDITERKRMEAALRASEEHFRTMAEVSPAVIYRLSPEGLISYASPAAMGMLGIAPADALGQHFLNFVIPDDHPPAMAAFQALLSRQTITALDLRLKCADGGWRWTSISVAPICDRERLIGIQGIAVDFTERKRAEQSLAASEARLSFVVSASPAVIYTCRPDGDYGATYISPNVSMQLGYAPDEFLSDPSFWAGRIHPEDAARVFAGLPRLFQEGRHVHEYRFRHKNGEWLWIRDELVLVRDSSGRVAEIIGSWLDITERKKAEEQLRLQAELQRIVAEISTGFIHLPAGELNRTISDALEKIVVFFEADRSYVFRFSRDMETMDNTHEWCAEGIEPQIHLLRNSPTAGIPWAIERLRRHETLYIPDVEALPPEAAAEKRDFQRQGIQSLISLPIERHDELIGFFGFDSVQRKRSWTAGEAAMLKVVADAIGGAIIRERTERALNDLNRELERRVEERTAEVLSRERIFAALSHSSPVGIVQTDAAGQYVYVNRRWCDIAGLSEEEAKGEGWMQAMHPEDRQRVQEQWGAAIQAGAPFGAEYRYLRAGGTMAWVMDQAVPFKDAGGGVAGYMGTVTDITERKESEEELLRSRQQYFDLVENVHDGIIRDDLEGRLTFANRRFREWFGLDGKDITKVALEDNIAPEWRQRIRDWHDRRVHGEPAPDHYECCCIRPGGERIWFEVSATPVVEQGRIVGTQSAVRDITERKRTEAERERLMTAIQQSGEAVLITDREGTIEYVNPAFTQITGYSGEEVLGRNSRILQSGKHDELFYRDLWQTITGGKVWHGRMINRNKDGAFLTLDVTISPVRDALGQIVNYVEVLRDITDELNLQQQLQQAQKMESIGRLAGGVAHDFNNLLTVINGHSELMLAKLDPRDPMYEEIVEVRKAGERAAGLTQQLLAFSRKQVIQPAVLDLNAVVRDVEKMLRRVMGEDIELVTVLNPDLGRIKADAGQLTQVLMNLAVNARDAMPDGGRLRIETENVVFEERHVQEHVEMEPGAYVQLTISDSGAGMDEATQARIFEPFFTTKETGGGTGLGLSTVYGIVRQGGGHIHVASQPGHGTTFKIYLPPVEAAATVAETEPLAGTLQGSETILVVEDQKDVRKLARIVLTSYGYKVLEAANAREALFQAESYAGPIDLMLTDVVMPGMNGRELAERLKPLRPALKVLFMSGYAENMLSSQESLDEDIAYLQKPFAPERLARKVREVLGPRRRE